MTHTPAHSHTPHESHAMHAHHPAATEIADYTVVVSSEEDFHASYHQFAEKVTRKLKAGYQLHGAPIGMGRVLCQAMVRPVGAVHSGESAMFLKHHVSRHD